MYARVERWTAGLQWGAVCDLPDLPDLPDLRPVVHRLRSHGQRLLDIQSLLVSRISSLGLDTVHIDTVHCVPPGACEYLPCGLSPGLRRVLKGQPHWSRCLLVDYDAPCPKARGRGCRRDHDTCNKSVTCFSSILYDRVERAIEAEEEAHVVLTAAFKGGDPTTILTSDAALKAAEASLQEARDTLADQAPGGDSAYK